jgi:hypothetical protein
MRSPTPSLAAGILLLALACHHRKKEPPAVPAPAPAPAAAPAPTPAPPPPVDDLRPLDASARIYYDDQTAFTDSLRMGIYDLESWQSVWDRATRRQASPPPLPQVDFDRQMLILVSAGRMHQGDEIHVDSVGTRGDRTVAVVRTVMACQPFPAASYPLEIVRVKRTSEPLVFVERKAKSEEC